MTILFVGAIRFTVDQIRGKKVGKGRSMRILKILVVAWAMAGCAYFRQAPEKPRVNLQNVNVSNATLTDATVTFYFLIENPNAFAIALDQIEYSLSLSGKPFSRGMIDKGLKVEASGSKVLPLPVAVKYSDVLSSFGDLLKQRRTEYLVEGTAKMGVLKIPFLKKGEVKLSDL